MKPADSTDVLSSLRRLSEATEFASEAPSHVTFRADDVEALDERLHAAGLAIHRGNQAIHRGGAETRGVDEPPKRVVGERVEVSPGTFARKVTLEVELRGQVFALSYNPARPESVCIVERDSLKAVPLADLLSAAARGKPVSLDGCRRPTLVFAVSRIGGADGVSLEVMHWLRIYARDPKCPFQLHVITGESTRSDEFDAVQALGVKVHVVPEADPSLPENQAEFVGLFGEPATVAERQRTGRDLSVIDRLFLPHVEVIESKIDALLDQISPDVIHLENFTLPWYHLAMGVAFARVIKKRGLCAVSRGHDFPHDRVAIYDFAHAPAPVVDLVSQPYLRSPSCSAIAINTRDLKYFERQGVSDVTIVPNTIDMNDSRVTRSIGPEALAKLREVVLGAAHVNDVVAIAPVRPVGRKRLDVALMFLKLLKDRHPDRSYTLLVTHDTCDGKKEELELLERAARDAGVHLCYGHERLEAYNHAARAGDRFDPWDQYRIGDFALYFSDFEGYGNGLLEVMAYKLPVYAAEYEVFARDIRTAGYDLMTIHYPPAFPIELFYAHGLSAFDRPEAGDLKRQLLPLVEDALSLLERKEKGLGLSEAHRRAVEKYARIIAEKNSYDAVEKLLRNALYKAFSAGNQHDRGLAAP